MTRDRPVFPFTALVGQDLMKKALILNAINHRIGGVLIRGHKGTAKSTAVRAFARILPDISATDCPYACDPDGALVCDVCLTRRQEGQVPKVRRRPVPFVDLPVGATEDRVVGSINLEAAIKAGERVFDPGLLAAANRGILYVDEVNLLADHLVDVLLDAAAMGQNYVEREGVSVVHPAQFLLVGTMNPEEGELRPQLLDRFALAVDVAGLPRPPDRAEVVRRRIAFEADPAGFAARWQEEEERERQRILAAQALLPAVEVGEDELDLITRICCAFEVDGLRGDIVMYKTAQALAAYAGRRRVAAEDVREAAQLALQHRRRRQPFDPPEFDRQRLDDLLQRQPSEEGAQPRPADAGGASSGVGGSPTRPHPGTEGTPPDQVFAAGTPFPVRPLTPPPGRPSLSLMPSGHRSRVKGTGGQRAGRYVGSCLPVGALPTVGNLALDATLRAAAPWQVPRRVAQPDGPALLVRPSDIREKVRETRAGNLVLFVVDASGSMAARQRMVAVKGAVLSLLLDAYQKRDRVGLIAFRGEAASLVVPPTNSVELAERRLRILPTGGRTPLAHGLALALETIERCRATGWEWRPWLVLISDGRPNVPLYGTDPLVDAFRVAEHVRTRGIQTLAIDTEIGPIRLGRLRQLAEQLGASCLRLEELAAGHVEMAVRREIGRFGTP
ncbi:MAG: magnesium chelatase subunit D family protein [Chloroflexi bacterium]|nr:magnesium chelatase subunit D family protein [Chloroflexota bacterium]